MLKSGSGMSPGNVAISIRNIGKTFIIRHDEKHTTLAEKIVAQFAIRWRGRIRKGLKRCGTSAST